VDRFLHGERRTSWRKGESTGVAFRLPYRMNNGIPEALNGFPFASPENEWV
jgi:hypothetical protein